MISFFCQAGLSFVQRTVIFCSLSSLVISLQPTPVLTLHLTISRLFVSVCFGFSPRVCELWQPRQCSSCHPVNERLPDRHETAQSAAEEAKRRQPPVLTSAPASHRILVAGAAIAHRERQVRYPSHHSEKCFIEDVITGAFTTKCNITLMASLWVMGEGFWKSCLHASTVNPGHYN